jgi:hypothetical protein
VGQPKTCGFCLESLADCCCDDDTPAPGLTVLRVLSEGGDDPGDPDPELYHVDSGAERM